MTDGLVVDPVVPYAEWDAVTRGDSEVFLSERAVRSLQLHSH